MYRYLLTLALASAVILVSSCSGGKSNAHDTVSASGSQEEEKVVLNEKLQERVGSWIEKGIECYGIVIATSTPDGKPMGKSVKCKVIALKPDMIRLKTLESVSLMESKGCDRLGLAYGDTWWEEEGDIFRTRKEADDFLVAKGWLIK